MDKSIEYVIGAIDELANGSKSYREYLLRKFRDSLSTTPPTAGRGI